ncbi:hypothetical protein HBP45_13705, partial [Listeria welshimeri]|nr:hypothetical protein [Listeria welshimeri]
AVNLTSTGLDLHGPAATVQGTYLRFTGLELPADAKITNAYHSFTVRDASTAAQSTMLNITGELGTQAAFASTVASFTSRTFTNAAVSMSTPAVVANSIFNTNDLTSVINEMRANTADLKDYVFKINGNGVGSFVMRSFDSSATMAPKLVIEYTSTSGDYAASISNTSDDAEERGTANAIDLN